MIAVALPRWRRKEEGQPAAIRAALKGLALRALAARRRTLPRLADASISPQ
tara:strand:+ start:1341 stop:1493 length:153 start_codon:yes stop_codon:yes gene_type:complete